MTIERLDYMKKYCFLVVMCMLVCGCDSYKVYTVRSGETGVKAGGLLYALPMTEVCVDVTFRHRDTAGAPYVAYADEMLTVDDDALYAIENVMISSRLVADPSHFYYVSPGNEPIQIDDHLLLRSIGMDFDAADVDESVPQHRGMSESDEDGDRWEYNLYDRVDTFYRRNDRPGRPSLLSSKKDSRSLRQRALSAAERIGNIQDRREQLLLGEVDDMSPEMVRYQLDMLDNQERMLAQQFVGKEVFETVRFVVTPKDTKSAEEQQSVVLFYFSPSLGIVDSGTVGAVPVMCDLRCENQLRSSARFVRHHTGDASSLDKRSTFKYRCSEMTEVSVWSPEFRYQLTVPVAQYGPIMELPKSAKKAMFDKKTGNLVFISK